MTLNNVATAIGKLYHLCLEFIKRVDGYEREIQQQPYGLSPATIHDIAKRNGIDDSIVVLFLMLYVGGEEARNYVVRVMEYEYSIDNCQMVTNGNWW